MYEIDQLLRIICIKKFSYITLSRKHRHVCPFFTAVEAYVFNLVFQHMLLHPGFSFNSSRFPKSLFRCFEQSSLLTIEKAIFQLWSQCPLCVNRRKIQELQHFPFLKAFSELANGLPSFIHHIETSGIFRLQSNQSCKSFWLKFCLRDYSTDIPTKISWQRYVIFPEFIGMSHILANCRIMYEHIAYWLQGISYHLLSFPTKYICHVQFNVSLMNLSNENGHFSSVKLYFTLANVVCGNAFLHRSINELKQLGKIYTKLFLRSSIRHKRNVANKAKLRDKLALNEYSCLVGTACLYHIMTCGNRLILDGRNIPQNSEWGL